jgi:hypothetical protein
MANLKPFQVKVKFKSLDGEVTEKEYGFNNALERKIYLWGLTDAAEKEVVKVEEINFRNMCLSCGSEATLSFLLNEEDSRAVLKESYDEGLRLIVDLCEECKSDEPSIALALSYSKGRVVKESDTFGLKEI